MELKEIIKDLGLESDINLMSLQVLETEYLSSEEKYDEFVERFVKLFFKRKGFPLRIADNYEKLQSLLNAGARKYPNDRNEALKKEYSLDVDYYTKNYDVKDKVDDAGFMQVAMMESAESHRLKAQPKYAQLVNGMHAAGVKYEARGEHGLGDFEEYYALVRLNINYADYERALNRYYEDHPLIDECCDLNFLYFANYLMRTFPKSIDKDFVQDVEDVIYTSYYLFEIGDKYNIKDAADYRKLAKYTMKNVKAYRKNEKKAQKSRIKELLRFK